MIRPVHYKSILRGAWLLATLLTLDASAQSKKEGHHLGTVYHHLRQVDETGDASFSLVRAGRAEEVKDAPGELKINTYPNPVTEGVTVTIPPAWQGKAVKIELISVNGRHVLVRDFLRAFHTELLPVAFAPKGAYILRASCEGTAVTLRIVKQ